MTTRVLLVVTTGASVTLQVARHSVDLHQSDVVRLCRLLGIEPTYGGRDKLLAPARCLPDLRALAHTEGIVVRDMARRSRAGQP